MNLPGVLVDQIKRTREWTNKLLADLNGAEWFYQPAVGLHHALWICGHLACAQDLLLFARCLQAPRLSPDFTVHFPIGGPILSADEHDYPAVEQVRYQMDEMQAATEDAISKLSESLLSEPAYGKDGTKHPHYDTKLGAISHISRHEAFHAGQLATIRRLLGKSFIR